MTSNAFIGLLVLQGGCNIGLGSEQFQVRHATVCTGAESIGLYTHV